MYSDVDYTGFVIDKIYIWVLYVFWRESLVTWRRKIQDKAYHPSVEVEFQSLAQSVWKTLEEGYT